MFPPPPNDWNKWDKLGLPQSTADKKLVELVSLDAIPSTSRIEYVQRYNNVSCVLEVKGLGVLVIAGEFPMDGSMARDRGVSIITEDELHHGFQ